MDSEKYPFLLPRGNTYSPYMQILVKIRVNFGQMTVKNSPFLLQCVVKIFTICEFSSKLNTKRRGYKRWVQTSLHKCLCLLVEVRIVKSVPLEVANLSSMITGEKSAIVIFPRIEFYPEFELKSILINTRFVITTLKFL